LSIRAGVGVAAQSGARRQRRRFLTSLATLAAAVSPSRPGTTAPGAAAPLQGAPPPFARRAKHAQAGWLRQSLKACTAEGLFAELINAFAGGALLTGWAIYLGASPLYTGLLVALPQIAQVLHVPGAWTTALLGHRRACLWLVGASRQVLLPLAILPFLPIDDGARRGVLLSVAGLAAVLGVLGNNAWVAWMGELVPKRIRGRYFGKRTGLCMLGGGLAAAAVGLLLDWARTRGLVGATLAGLQVLACLCGVVTVWLMRKQHDPSPPGHDGSAVSRTHGTAPPDRRPGLRSSGAHATASPDHHGQRNSGAHATASPDQRGLRNSGAHATASPDQRGLRNSGAHATASPDQRSGRERVEGRSPVVASISQALRPFRDRRMHGLFGYHFAWNVAVGVAGSFFALHMLRNLKMGFAMVALHGAATAAVRMLAAPMWGVLIDRLGARPVLAACSFGIAGIPFMWLLPTEARLWPLAIDALLAGIFWSGHALAVFALPLALTRRRERPFYVAAFAAVGGIAFTGATALGGTLASSLPDRLALPGLQIHNLQALFVLSGVLRLGAAFLSLRIQEPAARGVGELWSAITDRLGSRSAPGPAPAGTAPAIAPVPAAAAGPVPVASVPATADSVRPARRKTRSQAVPTDGADQPGRPA
jgi:MFS family permease